MRRNGFFSFFCIIQNFKLSSTDLHHMPHPLIKSLGEGLKGPKCLIRALFLMVFDKKDFLRQFLTAGLDSPPKNSEMQAWRTFTTSYIGVYTRKNGQNARSGPIFGDFWSKYLSRPIFYGRNGFPTQKWVRMHLETPLLPFMVALLFKKDQKRLRHFEDENLHNTPCTKCDCATRNQTKYALFLR